MKVLKKAIKKLEGHLSSLDLMILSRHSVSQTEPFQLAEVSISIVGQNNATIFKRDISLTYMPWSVA